MLVEDLQDHIKKKKKQPFYMVLDFRFLEPSFLITFVQTVITAMSELEPPIEIADPKNKERAQFMLDVVAKPGFSEYSEVL